MAETQYGIGKGNYTGKPPEISAPNKWRWFSLMPTNVQAACLEKPEVFYWSILPGYDHAVGYGYDFAGDAGMYRGETVPSPVVFNVWPNSKSGIVIDKTQPRPSNADYLTTNPQRLCIAYNVDFDDKEKWKPGAAAGVMQSAAFHPEGGLTVSVDAVAKWGLKPKPEFMDMLVPGLIFSAIGAAAYAVVSGTAAAWTPTAVAGDSSLLNVANGSWFAPAGGIPVVPAPSPIINQPSVSNPVTGANKMEFGKNFNSIMDAFGPSDSGSLGSGTYGTTDILGVDTSPIGFEGATGEWVSLSPVDNIYSFDNPTGYRPTSYSGSGINASNSLDQIFSTVQKTAAAVAGAVKGVSAIGNQITSNNKAQPNANSFQRQLASLNPLVIGLIVIGGILIVKGK